jgi:hypothetical protein
MTDQRRALTVLYEQHSRAGDHSGPAAARRRPRGRGCCAGSVRSDGRPLRPPSAAGCVRYLPPPNGREPLSRGIPPSTARAQLAPTSGPTRAGVASVIRPRRSGDRMGRDRVAAEPRSSFATTKTSRSPRSRGYWGVLVCTIRDGINPPNDEEEAVDWRRYADRSRLREVPTERMFVLQDAIRRRDGKVWAPTGTCSLRRRTSMQRWHWFHGRDRGDQT